MNARAHRCAGISLYVVCSYDFDYFVYLRERILIRFDSPQEKLDEESSSQQINEPRTHHTYILSRHTAYRRDAESHAQNLAHTQNTRPVDQSMSIAIDHHKTNGSVHGTHSQRIGGRSSTPTAHHAHLPLTSGHSPHLLLPCRSSAVARIRFGCTPQSCGALPWSPPIDPMAGGHCGRTPPRASPRASSSSFLAAHACACSTAG